jgi:hypothetical protein
MGKKDTLHLVVAPVRQVARDLRLNCPWVLWLLLIIFLYVVASSIAIMFIERWTFLHACYFTVINVTTVGFGDVLPITHWGKILAGINSLAGVMLLGAVVAAFTMALQPASGTSLEETKKEVPRDRDVPPEGESRLKNDIANILEDLAVRVRTADVKGRIRPEEGEIQINLNRDQSKPSSVRLYINLHLD